MLRRFTLALTATLLLANPVVAGTMQDSFQEANSDYWKKKYESAKDGYNTLLARYPLRHAVVFFPL
ncbi:MAG TPA: hypothetical protein EYN66_08405, partial [Myxococcales bacterium]|nr:hypothetical protein [Myxococcales bacterium]